MDPAWYIGRGGVGGWVGEAIHFRSVLPVCAKEAEEEEEEEEEEEDLSQKHRVAGNFEFYCQWTRLPTVQIVTPLFTLSVQRHTHPDAIM